jgi:hypothetical protein
MNRINSVIYGQIDTNVRLELCEIKVDKQINYLTNLNTSIQP